MKKNNDVIVKATPVRKKRAKDEVLHLQVSGRKLIKHELPCVQVPIAKSPVQHDLVFKKEVIAVKESPYERYLRDMQKYIDSLKKMDHKDAEKISRESLIRTGVLDHKGKQKEQICTGGMYVGRH